MLELLYWKPLIDVKSVSTDIYISIPLDELISLKMYGF